MLRIERLSFRVGNFQLREVSLRIEPMEYFVLMGATGSGKSLLAKSVCGLLCPASGSVFIDGRDVTQLEPRFRKVGYVPQEYGLFPHLTVVRNLTFALESASIRRRTAFEQIGPIVESLGLEPLLQRSTLNLSGGEKQKVALARALAARPKLLILDEPVSALDEPTRREICPLLKKTQQEFGVATLHICHSLEETRAVADRVGVMAAGVLAQIGTLDELIRTPATDDVRRLMLQDTALVSRRDSRGTKNSS